MRRVFLRDRHGMSHGVVLVGDNETSYTKYIVNSDRISKRPEDYYTAVTFSEVEGQTVNYVENGEEVPLQLFEENMPAASGYF